MVGIGRHGRIVGVGGALLLAVVVLTGCLDPTTGRPPARSASVPAYRSSTSSVTAADLGASWRSGCPVAPAALRRVRVDYWGYDGARHRGDLIVRSDVAPTVAAAFGKLYAGRFQIRRIHPITQYGASDDASMAANNTSAFNCRKVTGGSGWSEHAYGTAIDLNPVQNPYVLSDGTVLPASGKPWTDRSLRVAGMVTPNSVSRTAFAAVGWYWGGDWVHTKDYQHLSLRDR